MLKSGMPPTRVDLYKLFSPRPLSRATLLIGWARVIRPMMPMMRSKSPASRAAFRAAVISTDVAGYSAFVSALPWCTSCWRPGTKDALLNLQRQLSRLNLLIIDELGFVPLSRTGAELLFEVFSQRYERGSILVTTNLPFDEWTEVFGSERLTGALLDRLTHHVHILEMNGESYRLKRSRENASSQPSDEPDHVQLTLTLSPLAPRTVATPPAYGPRSSGRWYTIPPPQWPNFSAPLTQGEGLAWRHGQEAGLLHI